MNGKRILGIGIAIVLAVSSVACGAAAKAQGQDEPTPSEVVTTFYNWYLDYTRGEEGLRNPLVDGAYRSSEQLADGFIAEVDEILASFDGAGYDPILMAQDIPSSVTVGGALIDGEQAQVRVDTSFIGHALTVTLERLNGRWQITSIDLAPDTTVKSFYGWYLWYARGGQELRNPLVDGAYRDCGYLTGGFVDQIAQTLASFDKGGFDPILLAQDLPERVEVGEVTVTGDQASVKVQMFWGNNPTPSGRSVNLVLLEDGWKIDAVSQ